MKTIYYLAAIIFLTFPGFFQDTVLGQETPVDTIQNIPAAVDTVWVEKVRVDTVWVETPVADPKPEQIQEPAGNAEKSNKKSDKVYYGGYANLSFGQYTLIGFEPLIAYKLFPKFSVGGKLSYEYVKDKRYETDYESSNFGVSFFARRRFFRRLYAHIEFSEMSYKIYDSMGESERNWIPFLYLGGGVSLPITKRTSVNAEVLWDLIQNNNSPYKAGQPFFNVGIGVGF
jgi:hypothetical protein